MNPLPDRLRRSTAWLALGLGSGMLPACAMVSKVTGLFSSKPPEAPAPIVVQTPEPPPPPPPPPTVVLLRFVADADLNPDARARPSPLLLRLYELSSRAGFDKADFRELLTQEAQALGPALVEREEFTLAPGTTLEKRLEPGAQTRFVAVFASYRALDTAVWRQAQAVAAHEVNTFEVRLASQALRMQRLPSP